MSLIIVGIIFFVLVSYYSHPVSPLTKYASLAKGAAILMILGGLFSSVIVQIDTGTVGVQSLFGKVKANTLEPGLNFINPFVEVTRFDTKTQNYTMSGVHDEGDKEGDDAIRVLSFDGLEVVIDVTVLYRVMPEKTPTFSKRLGSITEM